jgi:hypothetical protein
MRRLLDTANVPSSPILVTLITEAIRSAEASVLTIATRRNIPQDGQSSWVLVVGLYMKEKTL